MSDEGNNISIYMQEKSTHFFPGEKSNFIKCDILLPDNNDKM
jgi:hypothetical protein